MISSKIIPILVFTLSVAGAQEPDRLMSLRDSYRSAVERSTAPLTRTYLTELEKLKTELTKRGDLQGALAVEAEIKSFSSKSSEPDSKEEESGMSPEGTDWKSTEKGSVDRIRIEGGKVIFTDAAGGQRRYEFRDEGNRTIRFNYGSGEEVTIKFDRGMKSLELSSPKGSFERE